MKTSNYNIINYGIRRSPRGGYGQYQVYGLVDYVLITAHSTNSEAFDWWNDDSDEEKQQEAIDYIFSLLERTYEEQLTE